MGRKGEAVLPSPIPPRLPERKKSDEKLYVCTYEFHFGYFKEFNRYRIHAMKLSDLFSFDLTPIPMFSSRSNSVLRQVAVVGGQGVPMNMGIGVFGSRIVLAGGCYERKVFPPRTYVLETDQSVEPNPRFISSSRRKPNNRGRRRRNKPPSVAETDQIEELVPIISSNNLPSVLETDQSEELVPIISSINPLSVVETDQNVDGSKFIIMNDRWNLIPRGRSVEIQNKLPGYAIPGLPGGQKFRPWLGEIDGKLYALCGREYGQDSTAFQVFDPKTKAWASLPSFPTGDDLSWEAIRPSNVAVVGTKIFVTLRIKYELEGQLLCFDMADPKATWSDREPRIRDDTGVFLGIFNKLLVVDSEEEKSEANL